MTSFAPVTELHVFTNSNDESITFNGPVRILWAHVHYTSDANAGSRALVFEIKDAAGGVLSHVPVQPSQVQGLLRHYMFSGLSLHDNAFVGTDHAHTPIPPEVWVPAGGSLRIFDSAGISALDDFDVALQYHPS